MRRWVTAAATAALLVCGSLGVPVEAAAPALARPTKQLNVEPAAPVTGERAVVTGRAPGPRGTRVKLQRLDQRRRWRTVDRDRTNRRRAFELALVVPVAATTLRAVVTERGRLRWRSQRLAVVPVAQSARVVLPTEARAGEPVVASAFLTPARPGRVVQAVVGSTVLGTAVEDANGVAAISFSAPAAGRHHVRVVALPTAGAGAEMTVASAAAQLRTTPAVSGIPRLDIVTDDGQDITSKESYKRATLTLDPRGSGVPAYDESVRLRVRGNFTSLVTFKRPYKLKLDADAPLAGMPASEDWVLLANVFDRTLLRTTLGFEISRRVGLPWSPRMVDTEVWLNGEFKGLYQLGEGIEVEADRLALSLAEDTPALGGFLLEADEYDDTDPRFTTSRGLQVYVKEPGDASDAYVAGVAAQLQGFEDALYSPAFADPVVGYRAWIDVASFVDWYLAMELTKNVDAGIRNSMHLYRPVGGRLTLGPAWDFDVSAGLRSRWDSPDPTGWFVRRNFHGHPHGVPSQYTGPEGHWFVRLFQDPAFEGAVRQRWREVRASLLALPAHLSTRRALIADAAARNFAPPGEGGGNAVGADDPRPGRGDGALADLRGRS